MSVDQVAAIAAEYRGLDYSDSTSGNPWEKVAMIRGTMIDLDFDDQGLHQVEVIWTDGILSADSLPVQDFCADDGVQNTE
jgi:hypothetical protein